jgi:hypothetical protein
MTDVLETVLVPDAGFLIAPFTVADFDGFDPKRDSPGRRQFSRNGFLLATRPQLFEALGISPGDFFEGSRAIKIRVEERIAIGGLAAGNFAEARDSIAAIPDGGKSRGFVRSREMSGLDSHGARENCDEEKVLLHDRLIRGRNPRISVFGVLDRRLKWLQIRLKIGRLGRI